MISYTSGTPTQRWQAFLEEAQVKSSPSNKIPDPKIKEIKCLLSDINPETGFVYNIREIAKKTGVGRNTISSINLKMRRHKN